MKRFRFRIRLKIYPTLWVIIILVSIYLLVRFAALSFSEDIGQAGLIQGVITSLYNKVINAEPSLITYTANKEEQNSYLVNLMEDKFALQSFIDDNSVSSSYVQGNSTLIQNDSPVINKDETAAAVEVSNNKYFSFHDIASQKLGLEYVMTNGAIINSEAAGRLVWDEDIPQEQLNVGFLKGDITPSAEGNTESEASTETAAMSNDVVTQFTMDQLSDVSFLVRNFYYVDASTTVTDNLFQADKLLNEDMTLKQGNDAPQILIFHTHSQEAFADSRPGEESDTVVGIGSYLAQVLKDEYGYNVIHDTTYYDVIGGKDGKNGFNVAYSESEAGVTKDLKDNPSIEVVIDLHRDSGDAKVVEINGEDTAQVMLFNGLCRDQNGPMTDLDNPNLEDNLSFSLQLQMKSLDLYSGLFRKIFLKSYRYNMYLKPKYLLVELGTYKNTVQQAKNAIKPFAQVLDSVLKGNKSMVGSNNNQ